MFCTNCGKELRVEDLFCAHCGTKVTPIEDNTLAENDSSTKDETTPRKDVTTEVVSSAKEDSTIKEDVTTKADPTAKGDSAAKENSATKEDATTQSDPTAKGDSATKDHSTDKNDLTPGTENALSATKKKITILLSTAVVIALLFLLSTWIISITYMKTNTTEVTVYHDPLATHVSSSSVPISVETLQKVEQPEDESILVEFERLGEVNILKMIDNAYICKNNILMGYLYNMTPTSDNFYPMNAKFNSYEKIDRYLTRSWAKGYALVFLNEFSYALRKSTYGYYILGSDMVYTPDIKDGKVVDISQVNDLIQVQYAYLDTNNTYPTDTAWFTKEEGKWKMTTLDVGKIKRSDIKIASL